MGNNPCVLEARACWAGSWSVKCQVVRILVSQGSSSGSVTTLGGSLGCFLGNHLRHGCDDLCGDHARLHDEPRGTELLRFRIFSASVDWFVRAMSGVFGARCSASKVCRNEKPSGSGMTMSKRMTSGTKPLRKTSIGPTPVSWTVEVLGSGYRV